MCGLLGALGDIDHKAKGVLTHLYLFTQLRGDHSAGAGVIERDNHKNKWFYQVQKRVGPPNFLMDSKEYRNALQGLNNKVVLGHTRSATVGAINMENAHPFLCEDTVIGAHNGTLRQRYQLEGHKTCDTDSEALFTHIAKHGVQDAINKSEGAYALTWIDLVEMTVNFLRNDERPLFINFSKDMKQMYWASEAWMLNIAMSRVGVDKVDQPFELPVDTLFTFRIPSGFSVLEAPQEVRIEKEKKHWSNRWNKQDYSNNKTGGTGTGSNERGTTFTRDNGKRPGSQESLKFYVVGSGRNEQGAEFLRGVTILNEEVRVHVNAHCLHLRKYYQDELLGHELEGTISAVHADGNGSLYFMSPWSVKEQEVILPAKKSPSENSEDRGQENGSRILLLEKPLEQKVFTGPQAQLFTELEWRKFIEVGCCTCGDVASILDHDDIQWFDNGTYICQECADGYDTGRVCV